MSVQQNPRSTIEEKAAATQAYTQAMTNVKYMQTNPQATAVQDSLYRYNDPIGWEKRHIQELRGGETASTDILGLASATGTGTDATEGNFQRSHELEAEFAQMQQAAATTNEALASDPQNPQLLARAQAYESKMAAMDDEYKNLGPSSLDKGLYMAGAMVSPEDAAETYGLGKALKGTIRGVKGTAKGITNHLKNLRPSKAPVNKVVLDSRKPPAPARTRGGTGGKGKVMSALGRVTGAAGKAIGAAGKVVAPLAAADAVYTGSKAAWGDSPEAEALRDRHRREADAGESLAFTTPKLPGQGNLGYGFQETLKAVNLKRAAGQVGTMGRDIGTTAGEYLEADEATKAAMREGAMESLNNNILYKATGGEDGSVQGAADYLVGPDTQKDRETGQPVDIAEIKRRYHADIARAKAPGTTTTYPVSGGTLTPNVAEAPVPAIKTEFNASLSNANRRTPAVLPDFPKL